MYQVSAYTHNKYSTTHKVIDKQLAISYFNEFIACEDCAEAVIINGLTGEVEYQWVNGKFQVIDGYIV